MVLDSERSLIAVKNKYIFLSPQENICLDLIIKNKYKGISGTEIRKATRPYYIDPQQVVTRINKKIRKYGHIYSEHKRYKIIVY